MEIGKLIRGLDCRTVTASEKPWGQNDLPKQTPSSNLSADRAYDGSGWGGTDSKKESPMLDWVGGSSFAEHGIR